MTDTVVAVTEAHDRLSELVSMAQQGATVQILKRGKVAARLVPPENISEQRKGCGPDLAALLEQRLAARLGPWRTEEDIAEGIRIEREAWD